MLYAKMDEDYFTMIISQCLVSNVKNTDKMEPFVL